LQGLGLRLHGRNRAQIVIGGCRGQRTGIDLSYRREDGICYVLVGEWAEPQTITSPAVFAALNLIHLRVFTAGDGFRGYANRRRRYAEIDHEGSGAAEARCLRQRREQVIDAQVPNVSVQWRIYRRSHKCFSHRRFRHDEDIGEARGMKP
jgi:hypothetical protein